ncbi:SPFH domain-containing protein [Vibrio sp. D431a]|uniref:SPFH domain-containing protein n=1 Tax=Vibrio sp. D431a TaxID=2837388 RepID=UPI0025565863|nr:SPFH domain-containing protein [Vibrio sp. D431a]MDK9790664.1 hypothetical protein [Vibrio sp. D431a]
MKKKLLKLAVVALGAMTLSGCNLVIGEGVSVPAAHVGKVFGKDGYKNQLHHTSRFRLDRCFAYCDKLVTLSVADMNYQEVYEQLIPADELKMTYTVNTVLSVRPDSVEQLFKSVPANAYNQISLKDVYFTYVKTRIRSATQEVIARYTINHIASNITEVEQALRAELDKTLEETPFMLKTTGINNPQYPDVITEAKENAAKRREMLAQEEAELQIQRVKMVRDLEQAEKQAEIDRVKAESERAVNKIMSDSVNENYVMYKQLEALGNIATSENKVFVPFGVLDTVGASTMMLGNSK